MKKKACSKCGKEKPATAEYFCRRKDSKDGLRGTCRKCHKKWWDGYYKNNAEKLKERTRDWNKLNRERSRETHRQYQKANPEEVKIGKRRWRDKNRQKIIKAKSKWREENREKINEYNKDWRAANPKSLGDRLSDSMRTGICRSLKSGKGEQHWESLVEFTLDDLIVHLEAQFTEGMSWDNYGEWHIDHRRPISSFGFASSDGPDFKKCWSLENLQPLWEKDNMRKGAKYKEAV